MQAAERCGCLGRDEIEALTLPLSVLCLQLFCGCTGCDVDSGFRSRLPAAASSFHDFCRCDAVCEGVVVLVVPRACTGCAALCCSLCCHALL